MSISNEAITKIFDLQNMDDRYEFIGHIDEKNYLDDKNYRKIYFDLVRLREELESFIHDIVSLEQGNRIIYMVDDVLLRSFIEMNDDNKKSFTFPVSTKSYEKKIYEKRKVEYLLRLNDLLINPIKTNPTDTKWQHKVFFPSQLAIPFNNSLLAIKRKHDNTFSQIKDRYSNPKESADIDTITLVIENSYNQIMKSNLLGLEEDNGNRNDLIKNVKEKLTELNIEVINELEQLCKNYGMYSNMNTRREMLSESETILWGEEALINHLSNYSEVLTEQFKKTDLVNQENSQNELLIGNIVHTFEYCLEQSIKSGINTMASKDANKQREKIIKRVTNFQYVAQAMGRMMRWNQFFKNLAHENKIEHHYEIQFISHRHIPANMIRFMGLYHYGLPIRHPKFLATRLKKENRTYAASRANRLIILLDKFNQAVRNKPTDIREFYEKFQYQFVPAWISFKQQIYMDEHFDQGNNNKASLKKATKVRSKFQFEYLMRQIITNWGLDKQQQILCYEVAERQKNKVIIDPRHIMVCPSVGGLRYFIKLPLDIFKDSSDPCEKNGVIKFIENIKKTHFAQALTAAIGNNWEGVASILEEEDFSKEDNKFFKAEILFLRHLGYRGAAVKTKGAARALTLMIKSYKDIIEMKKNNPNDLRFQLAEVAWKLELAFFIEKKGIDYERVKEDQKEIPGNPTLFSLGHEMIKSCVCIYEQLNNKNYDEITNDHQIKYWLYIKGRTLQCLFMIYAAIKYNCIPRAAESYMHITIGINRIDKKTLKKYHTELFKFNQEYAYPACTFLSKWVKLDLLNEEFEPSPNSSEESLEKLTQIFEDRNKLEEQCQKLNENGFPRNFFLHIKKELFAKLQQASIAIVNNQFDSSLNQIERAISKIEDRQKLQRDLFLNNH